MVSEYCGNNCETCESREKLRCPGCAAGPGGAYTATCRLAKCCIRKGIHSCASCAFVTKCGIYLSRADMPGNRIRELERAAAHQSACIDKAAKMEKWLWILFWLFIPSMFAAMISNVAIDASAQGFLLFGTFLSIICNLVNVVALFCLGHVNGRYKTAAWIMLICTSVTSIFSVLQALGSSVFQPFLLTFLSGAGSLLAVFQESRAHSEAISDLDEDLSMKWERFWKLHLGTTGALIFSVVILVIANVLGLLLLMISSIATVVVGILRLVYLYRSAKICGWFAAKPR